MADPKMKKCRACGKDAEVGKPCEACGWDEDKEKTAAKRRFLEKAVDSEVEQEMNPPKPEPKRLLPFSR